MKKLLSVLILLVNILLGSSSPYLLKKFHSILNISKLQAPISHYNPLYSVPYGEFKNYSNKFFYLQDNRYMVFYMCGKKHRSELRIKEIWKVNSKKDHIITARIKLFPLNAKREFTFLQIHTDPNQPNSIDKPLLRITWMKNYRHRKNHLWAVIKMSPNEYENIYKKIDLGKLPKRFFDIEISVKDSKLNIEINNKSIIKNFDVSYWKEYYNYFKAGVYLQDDGCAKALFDQLYLNKTL